MKIESLVSLNAGNTFLAADGLANLPNILALRKDIETYLRNMKPISTMKKTRDGVNVTVVAPVKQRKEAVTLSAVLKPLTANGKVKIEGEAGKFVLSFVCEDKDAAEKAVAAFGKSSVVPAPMGYYTVPKRSKAMQYSAARAKAKEPNYMKKRAIAVSLRSKLTETSTQILPVYANGVLSAALEKKMKAAATALNSHIKKVPATKEAAGKVADKNRAAKAKEYGALAKEVIKMLTDAGIKSANIILGKSISGQTLYVKLPSGKVMTVGLSSMTNFNTAKKAAAEAYTEDELE